MRQEEVKGQRERSRKWVRRGKTGEAGKEEIRDPGVGGSGKTEGAPDRGVEEAQRSKGEEAERQEIHDERKQGGRRRAR